MATYRVVLSRCSGGNHVVILATTVPSGTVTRIELTLDELRGLRSRGDDYRALPDLHADILIALRELATGAGATNWAQIKAAVENVNVVTS